MQYKDWLGWLESKRYYGEKITEKEIEKTRYPTAYTGEFLELWINDPKDPSNVFSEWDITKAQWTFSMMWFSENYYEYISFLNVLRSVDRFTQKDTQSFILIHNYLFGDTESDTLVEINHQKSELVTAIPDHYVEEARTHLDERLNNEEDPMD